MQAALVTMPRWVQYAVAVAVVADVGVAFMTALTPKHLSFGGLIGGPLGVLGVLAYQNRHFDRLTKADRLRVLAAMRSGVSTGDDRLDALAREKLSRKARSYRSDRILLPGSMTVALACPVIAALRHQEPWWLLLLLPMLAVFSHLRLPDPRPPLAALEAG